MKNGMKRIVAFAAAMVLLLGCQSGLSEEERLTQQVESLNVELAHLNQEILTLKAENRDLKESLKEETFIEAAVGIMAMVRDEDWEALSARIHPDMGVRFSAYDHVVEDDLVFSAAEIAAFGQTEGTLDWGIFDGTGDPILATRRDYYKRFVYDADFFSAPVIGRNTRVSYGNLINNVAEFYPDAVWIEFHFPQIDPQYMGMDWRSLTLVLESVDGIYYLVGVVHGEWTI